MAKQRFINTHFWDDSYIVELDPIEKLLYLYLLTNPLTDIAGAYEINIRRMAFDTGIDREMILKILDRFAKADKIIYRDGWILILNFVKNQSQNPSVVSGVVRSLNCCPDWIRDRLTAGGDRLPQAVVLNLTKPNLTELNLDPTDVRAFSDPDDSQIHIDKILAGIRAEYGLNTIRDEQGWVRQAEWAYDNEFAAEDFINCLHLMRKQKWRTGRITPENVADNLPELTKLRMEIRTQDGPSDVGKNQDPPDEYKCKECFDSGEVRVLPEDPTDWQNIKWVDCPDCVATRQEVAA